MKSNKDMSLASLIKKEINEATILKPAYEIGSQFFYKGGIRDLDDAGYKEGDVFTVVKLKSKIDIQSKSKDGETYTKTIQAPDGKKFTLAGSLTAFKPNFIQLKAGASVEPKGEDWEGLIVVAHNKKFEGPEWERVEKFWSNYGDTANKIAKDFKSKLKQKNLRQFGSSRATLSGDWLGKNATPKTDILGNSLNISLKKKGGSQLLSGTKDEVISTFIAASKYVAKKETKMVKNFVDSLEEKMKTLYYNGTVTDLKKKVEDGSLTIKKDPIVKQYEKMKLDQKELTDIMNRELFNSDKFKLAFAFEAATGTSKFSSKEAVADTLVGFDADAGVVSKILTVKKVEDVKPIADNTKFYFSFKSTGKNPMMVLRGQIGESKKKRNYQTLSEILVTELGKYNKELGEGIQESLLSETSTLNEFSIMNNLTNFIEKIPGAVKGVKDKFLDIVKNIFEAITKAFDKIKQMGEKIIDGIMDFFGLELDETSTQITSSDPDFPLV